jgi:hypothetical protein
LKNTNQRVTVNQTEDLCPKDREAVKEYRTAELFPIGRAIDLLQGTYGPLVDSGGYGMY